MNINQTTASTNAIDEKQAKDLSKANPQQISPKKRRAHNTINYKEYDKHGNKKLISLKNIRKNEELEYQDEIPSKKNEI